MKKFIFSGILMFFSFCLSLNAQILTVTPTVTYLTPTSETGAIFLDVIGGSGTYTYEWSLNNDTSFPATGNALLGLEKGIYRVTITDPNTPDPDYPSESLKHEGKFNLYYTGVWDSSSNLDLNGTIYTKADDPTNPQGYATAISNNMFETNSWKYFEFDVHDVESHAMIGFVNANNLPSEKADILYGIQLIKDISTNETSWQIIESGLDKNTSTTFNINEGIKLRIMIQPTSKRVRYYIDDFLQLQTSYIQLPQMHIGMLVGTGLGISLDWNTNLLYKNLKVNSNYAKLKKKLDGAFVKVLSETQSDGSDATILKFTYSERYHKIVNENDKAKCTIYNWKRESGTLGTIELNNDYGKNWQEIDVSHLPSGFYTLEVTGVNKNEKYYLRFKK